MIREYIPLVLLTGFVIVNAIGMLVASHLLLRRRPTAVKDTPYESGMPPLGSTRERFSVKFYLIAMLFIIFDIEMIFLIPWGVALRQVGTTAFVAVLIFIVVLEIGHVYAWKRGALEWES